jgi:amino acid adenylation domain-containing protein
MRDVMEGILELTPLQSGILFHSQYAPASDVYNVQLDFHLHGALNFEALERTWQSLVVRHAALRTGFVWQDLEHPYQVVHREAQVSIAQTDLRGLSEEDRDNRLALLVENDRSTAFSLVEPPLMRLTLARVSDHDYRLLWTFHHIILEGWSAAILIGEARILYESYCKNGPPQLPPPRALSDYLHWLKGCDSAAAETHWRHSLAGFREAIRIPFDMARDVSPPKVVESDACCVTLSRQTSDDLRKFARENGLTLNTLAQGAWALLLSRYTLRDDVVFGVVMSGRPAELEGAGEIVGMCINTLPARVRVAAGEAVVDWLQQLQRDQAELREFQFSALSDVQGFSEAPAGQPLFESLVVFENWAGDLSGRQWGDDLEVGEIDCREGSDYPLAMVVTPADELQLVLMYDRGRFQSQDVARLLKHYRALLEGLIANPTARISSLPLLDELETRQLLSELSVAESEYPRTASIPELFEALVDRAPEALAVEFGKERLTYGELNARANQLAHVLQEAGVTTETLVGVCLERGLEMIVSLLAILKAGGAYVPLDSEYPQQRLKFMLDDAQAPVLVTDSRFAKVLPEHDGRVIHLDKDAPDIGRKSDRNLATEASGSNLAYVMYTSGSTGTPKGACILHRAITRVACNTNYLQLNPSDRVAQAANSSFDAATFEIWGPLLNGASVVVMPREVLLSPPEFARQLQASRITALFLTTALFNQMVRQVQGAFRTLRHLLFGGEAVDPAIVHALLKDRPPRRLLHMYGPTETTTFATWQAVQEVEQHATTVPIGRPIANTEVYLLDEQRQPVPVGAVGELYIGGDGVARGYWQRPELTRERFVAHPFSDAPGARLYRTGDYGCWRTDGAIEFLGRRDQQIKIRGFRVELGEIEYELRQHSEVRNAVATIREEEPGDRRIVAYVVLDRDQGVPADLRTRLAGKLPSHMMPSAIVPIDAIPLTPNGKVDREALPSPGRQRPGLGADYSPPSTDQERRIAAIWERILRVEGIGLDDNFFESGGNSLLLIRLHGELQAITEQEISITDLFQHPTIRSLAELLEKGADDASDFEEIRTRARQSRVSLGRPRLHQAPEGSEE